MNLSYYGYFGGCDIFSRCKITSPYRFGSTAILIEVLPQTDSDLEKLKKYREHGYRLLNRFYITLYYYL